LKSIGVDEVARAKGHDYMTVIYDMVAGHLIGVETGRTSGFFSGFLNQLKPETASEIEAVAMDMGGAPANIEQTILDGRIAGMPAWGIPLGGEAGVSDVTGYVLSLSGRKHDAEAATRGQANFTCFALAAMV
jgi:hypothetical protein